MGWRVKGQRPGFSTTFLVESPGEALVEARRFRNHGYDVVTITTPDGSTATQADVEALIDEPAPSPELPVVPAVAAD